jgi:hypothetical protein
MFLPILLVNQEKRMRRMKARNCADDYIYPIFRLSAQWPCLYPKYER